MKCELDELMMVLKRIDYCYAMHDECRRRNDLTHVFLFINAAVLLTKVDYEEARVMLDIYAVNFIEDVKYVNNTIAQAMRYVSSNKFLPTTYKESEYIAPLQRLEDFLLLSST